MFCAKWCIMRDNLRGPYLGRTALKGSLLLHPFKEDVDGKEGRSQEAGREMEGRRWGREWLLQSCYLPGFKPANATEITFTFKETGFRLSLGPLMYGV